MREPLDPAWLEAHRLDPAIFPAEPLVGIDHALAHLERAVAQLLDPPAARILRSHPLLYGPPGTGKTSALVATARAFPELPVYAVDTDELSAGVVRALFAELPARHPHAVLAVEEADWAIARDDLRHSSRTRALLSAFLSVLDGRQRTDGLLLVVTTNREPWELEPALLRPGRLGELVHFPLPSDAARRALLETLLASAPVDGRLDLERAVLLTAKASPADIRLAVQDAQARARADGREAMTEADLRAGLGSHGMVEPPEEETVSPVDLRRAARHEGGHLAVALACLPGAREALRVVRVGSNGGDSTWARSGGPETESELDAHLAIAYGGLAAERLIYGEASTGSASDIWDATQHLRARLEAALDDIAPPLSPRGMSGLASDGLRALWTDVMTERAERALAVAEQAVAAERDAIERFAEALVAAEGELAGDELRAAVAAARFHALEAAVAA